MTFKFIVPLSNRNIYDRNLGLFFKKATSLKGTTMDLYYKYLKSECSMSEYGDIESFDCEVLLIPNIGNDSIFKKYNRGIAALDIKEEDIAIFIHEDVTILDTNFLQKVRHVFEKDDKVGVLGIVGTTEFTQAGGWWLNPYPDKMKGHWRQGHPNGQVNYMRKSAIGYFDDMVSIDGLFMAVRGSVLKDLKFDENTYPNAYHFYDVDFCFSAIQKGWKVAIENILLEHRSEGPMGASWQESYKRFLSKWKNVRFPITVNKLRGE